MASMADDPLVPPGLGLCGRCGRLVPADEMMIPACRPPLDTGDPILQCECGTPMLPGMRHPALCRACGERRMPWFDADHSRLGDRLRPDPSTRPPAPPPAPAPR